MAATPTDPPAPSADDRPDPLGAEQLRRRLEEEIGRAERYGTALSCLLVGLQDPDGLARAHGEGTPERALECMSRALAPQLRRFDRVGLLAGGQLLVVLPGADERRGEIVARRALRRLRAVKLEHGGARQAIAVRIGLTAWRSGLSAEQLVERSRRAARPESGRSAQPSSGRS